MNATERQLRERFTTRSRDPDAAYLDVPARELTKAIYLYHAARKRRHAEQFELWHGAAAKQEEAVKDAEQAALETAQKLWGKLDREDPPDEAVTDEDLAEARLRDFRTHSHPSTAHDYHVVYGHPDINRDRKGSTADLLAASVSDEPEQEEGEAPKYPNRWRAGWGVYTYRTADLAYGRRGNKLCGCGCGEVLEHGPPEDGGRPKEYVNDTHRKREERRRAKMSGNRQ